MRTTIDLDEDVLLAAKEIARQKRSTLGKVMSDLTREALTQRPTTSIRSGLPLFPVQQSAGIVSLSLVNRLRDEEA